MSTASGLGRVYNNNNYDDYDNNYDDYDDYDNNDDNTPTTGSPTIVHPIIQTTLPLIPEVYDNCQTPPPWTTRLLTRYEDHVTRLEAMAHLLVADSSVSNQCFISLSANIAAFNKRLDSMAIGNTRHRAMAISNMQQYTAMVGHKQQHAATMEDHVTQLKAMVHLLVTDSHFTHIDVTHITADIAAFNERIDSLHNNLLTDVLAAADTHVITSITNTLPR